MKSVYADPTSRPGAQTASWSDELEELHEEASRTHFIDVWTRRAMLTMLPPLTPRSTVVDLGCSTGYLLQDLRDALPQARLVGFDLIFAGLRKAVGNAPDAVVAQADCCFLPLADEMADAVVSANLLEHVADDRAALAEIHRILRPGGSAVLVVPAGPGMYDYYDRFLLHERRYARGELAGKARTVGLTVVDDIHLGWTMYPAFWAVKKRNRLRFDALEGDALKARVARDISQTNDSRLGHLACGVEERVMSHGHRVPFGIRGLTVVQRPATVAA